MAKVMLLVDPSSSSSTYSSLTNPFNTNLDIRARTIGDYDNKMRAILNSNLPESDQLALYNENLTKKTILGAVPKPTTGQSNTQNKGTQVINTDRIDKEVLSILPKKDVYAAKRLLARIKNMSDISYDDDGGVQIYGKKIPGGNITDLIYHAISTRKNLPGVEGMELFRTLLRSGNTPQHLFGNKTFYGSPETKHYHTKTTPGHSISLPQPNYDGYTSTPTQTKKISGLPKKWEALKISPIRNSRPLRHQKSSYRTRGGRRESSLPESPSRSRVSYKKRAKYY
jgi:hypothetical protein